MRSYILSEAQKAWVWYKKMVVIFAQWIFQMFLRLFILCVTLYVLGGGCLLRSYQKSAASEKQAPMSPQYRAGPESESYREAALLSPYRERNETFQSQIRTGQSQVRSWDYTVRSIKNDIERWFRK